MGNAVAVGGGEAVTTGAPLFKGRVLDHAVTVISIQRRELPIMGKPMWIEEDEAKAWAAVERDSLPRYAVNEHSGNLYQIARSHRWDGMPVTGFTIPWPMPEKRTVYDIVYRVDEREVRVQCDERPTPRQVFEGVAVEILRVEVRP
jgi:hypothetical protein